VQYDSDEAPAAASSRAAGDSDGPASGSEGPASGLEGPASGAEGAGNVDAGKGDTPSEATLAGGAGQVDPSSRALSGR